MNKRRPDFAIELGDFKDCTKTGSRAETVGLLDEVETEFRQFPRAASMSPATMILTKFRLRIFWRTLKTQTK